MPATSDGHERGAWVRARLLTNGRHVGHDGSPKAIGVAEEQLHVSGCAMLGDKRTHAISTPVRWKSVALSSIELTRILGLEDPSPSASPLRPRPAIVLGLLYRPCRECER